MKANTNINPAIDPETILNIAIKKEEEARRLRRDAEFASAAGESRLADVWSERADDLLREVDELLALV